MHRSWSILKVLALSACLMVIVGCGRSSAAVAPPKSTLDSYLAKHPEIANAAENEIEPEQSAGRQKKAAASK